MNNRKQISTSNLDLKNQHQTVDACCCILPCDILFGWKKSQLDSKDIFAKISRFLVPEPTSDFYDAQYKNIKSCSDLFYWICVSKWIWVWILLMPVCTFNTELQLWNKHKSKEGCFYQIKSVLLKEWISISLSIVIITYQVMIPAKWQPMEQHRRYIRKLSFSPHTFLVQRFPFI